MAFSTVPTPLYPVYEQERHYGVATMTVVFAIYPLAVMASVHLVGHVSDLVGRRRALAQALALEAASAAAFVASAALPVLLLARVVCGIGVGILTATAAAYLSELDAGANRRRSDAVTTGATLGGFGAGALVSGLLAAVAPAPLHLPFLLFLVLLIPASLAARHLPETLPAPTGGSPFRSPRIAVPRDHRRRFIAACAAGFAALSLLSVFTALAPGFLTRALHEAQPALAGLTAATCCIAAGAGQAALPAPVRRHLMGAGLVLLPSGVLVLILAVWRESFPLFLAAGAVGGVGSGALLNRALATVDRIAPPSARAEAFAGFYMVGYLNGTLPIVGLGVLTQTAGPLAAVGAYAGMLAIVLGLVGPVRSGVPPAFTPAADPALVASSLDR
jgi:predicted MFS family arabinose efflux permease